MNMKNPIFYCEICDVGAHQKCWGVEDIEKPFYCDWCYKKRHREYPPESFSCGICKKEGCLMKYEESLQKWYHPFCLGSNYGDWMNMREPLADFEDPTLCGICGETGGAHLMCAWLEGY